MELESVHHRNQGTPESPGIPGRFSPTAIQGATKTGCQQPRLGTLINLAIHGAKMMILRLCCTPSSDQYVHVCRCSLNQC
jgi:hypothetical protein